MSDSELNSTNDGELSDQQIAYIQNEINKQYGKAIDNDDDEKKK